MTKKRIAVIGGGISGLAAANKLIGSGFEIQVFEAADKPGGKLASEMVDGFLIEGGADSFVASRPRIVSLCDELGLKDQLVPPNGPGLRAYIYRKGSLYPIPEGFSGLVPTRLKPIMRSKLLSPLGKLRLLAELQVPPNTSHDDESLKSFSVRRFGNEAYERLLEPLLAGISSGNGDELSLAASFPHWKTAELEYGSVIKGITAARPGQTNTPRISGFLTLRNGMGQLVDAFVERLRGHEVLLNLNTIVRQIEIVNDGYLVTSGEGNVVKCDGLILAVPAWNAASLLHDIDRAASAALQAIPQKSSAQVSLGYRDPAIVGRLKGTGYLVPSSEGRISGGTTWSSSKWPNRADRGSALIRVYFGRGSGQGLISQSDDVLVEAAQTELRETLGIVAEPAVRRVTRWIDSMPQYTLGHLDRVSAIEQGVCSHPGLAIAGNMLRGVGIPICVQSGEAAAEKVLSALNGAQGV